MDVIKAVKNDSLRSDISHMGQSVKLEKSVWDDLKLIHADSDDVEFLKSFRELRTRLFTQMQGKNFVCLVTSVAPKGGGSYVARNLAAAIVMDKTKTALLVDTNFYSPSVDGALSVKARHGLTDFLDDDSMTVEDIVYPSFVPRLRVIPVGNNCDGGTEKLMLKRMKIFVAEIKDRYRDRMVIIDGPCIREYDAEARILSDLCDFVILVVPDNKVTEAEINDAVATVGREKVAGFVLNHVATQ